MEQDGARRCRIGLMLAKEVSKGGVSEIPATQNSHA